LGLARARLVEGEIREDVLEGGLFAAQLSEREPRVHDRSEDRVERVITGLGRQRERRRRGVALLELRELAHDRERRERGFEGLEARGPGEPDDLLARRARAERGDLALGHELALADDEHALAARLDLREDVRREDDRLLAGEAADE